VTSFDHVRLYCFSPGRLSGPRDPVALVEEQIRGGADVIQLREKEMSKRDRLALGFELRRLTRNYGVLFIVNDDVDLALILEADGVHLGQEDIPIDHARPLMKDRIIGVSTHSLEQAMTAVRQGADYIGVGPVFPTKTKENPDPTVGLSLLERVGADCPIPFVAIGGIGRDNLELVVKAGCRRAAVISDILLAPDVAERCRELKRMLA